MRRKEKKNLFDNGRNVGDVGFLFLKCVWEEKVPVKTNWKLDCYEVPLIFSKYLTNKLSPEIQRQFSV